MLSTIQIVEITQNNENTELINEWSSGLWWGDFEEANISTCYVVYDDDRPVAFQSVNLDGLCVAIETHPDYQGQGIASLLVGESNCWRPERNECPEFWKKMQEKFGW